VWDDWVGFYSIACKKNPHHRILFEEKVFMEEIIFIVQELYQLNHDDFSPVFFLFSFEFYIHSKQQPNYWKFCVRVNLEATGSTGRIRACARQFQLKPIVESFTNLQAPGRFLIFPRAISLENNLKTKNKVFQKQNTCYFKRTRDV
jgi:hypothetical protein